MANAKSLETFRVALRKNFETYKVDFMRIYDDWMLEIPTQLLVIADSVSMLEDRNLLARFIDGSNLIQKFRDA